MAEKENNCHSDCTNRQTVKIRLSQIPKFTGSLRLQEIDLLDVKVPSPTDMICKTSTNQRAKYTGNCKYGIDDAVYK